MVIGATVVIGAIVITGRGGVATAATVRVVARGLPLVTNPIAPRAIDVPVPVTAVLVRRVVRRGRHERALPHPRYPAPSACAPAARIVRRR